MTALHWSAARFGVQAMLLHPDGSSYVPVSELAAELLELLAPVASRLGGGAQLARIDPRRCEADAQAAAPSPAAAIEAIVAATLS